MAKHGFKVMDSDLHTMEPDDLWELYLDQPFKKFATKFARNPPVAMALLKAALNRGSDSVDQAINTEADYQAVLYATADHEEAARAFLEKRRPVFTGQ